jgi:tetratricopeptide (TPR) repeat protein
MPTPFLSSEEYDERAHQLYNEGQYDNALDILREGLKLYPNAVELHIGVGYARLAREEFLWARRTFEEALVLDPDHEDALAGLGETLLKFGLQDAGVRCFRRILELGYHDDVELILQSGRALFREGLIEDSKQFFDIAVGHAPEMAEAVALLGFAQHRLGSDEDAITTLRRALQLDSDHAEARIYLGNVLYDRGDHDGALYHLDRTSPDEHWDELGIWRLIELKKSIYRLDDDDPEISPWEERLADLQGDGDSIDDLLAEVESRVNERELAAAKGQLELFGGLLTDLAQASLDESMHRVVTADGREFSGTWDVIVRDMRNASAAPAARSVHEFMQSEARREYARTGIVVPTADAKSFVRGSADAGLLRILR